VALGATIAALYLFFSKNSDLLTPEAYPTWSFGYKAKGLFAVGVHADGVFCLGIFVNGLFSVGLMGVGLVFYGGGWGATLGIGVYHIGMAWYCMMGQLSINIYCGFMIHIGINLLGPCCNKYRRHKMDRFIVNHCDCVFFD